MYIEPLEVNKERRGQGTPKGWKLVRNGALYQSTALHDCTYCCNILVLYPAASGEKYLSLGVHRWVPVGVVKDHRVRTSQIDAEAAGSRRQDEAEQLRVKVKPVPKKTKNVNVHVCT